MKTLHSGSSEFPFVRTERIKFDWKFEDAGDHEHPYILTVTVAGETRSEGCPRSIDDAGALEKAQELAREVYESAQEPQ